MKSLTIFNNKGGVGKTTLLCNIAAYLQDTGYKVLVIDADPQCNATQYVFDDNKLDYFFNQTTSFTIYDVIKPLSSGKGYSKTLRVAQSPRFGFDVLPGDPRLALTEDLLARDWGAASGGDIRGIRTTLLFVELLERCEDYDLVIFDVGPSLGSINRAVLLASDFFVSPMSIDIFSVKAIQNIAVWLERWRKQWDGAQRMLEADEELDELEASDISFLGYVSQQYIAKRDGSGTKRAVNAYDRIMSQFDEVIRKELVKPKKPNVDFHLGSIPNLHSLIPMSQTNRAPIFDLRSSDGVRGAHFSKVKASREIFGEIADNIIKKMEL